jgi:hypothetical protein
MTIDIGALNSATKYPSIETYHTLNPRNGLLSEPAMAFTGTVVLTEKVNGTNGRIIVLPDGDWYIGSREELLYARGDRIINPALGIVQALLPLAGSIASTEHEFSAKSGTAWVYYLEVYGHRIGSGAKNYTTHELTGFRLFDVAAINTDVLGWPRDKISSWREHGGQSFLSEDVLHEAADLERVQLVPRLGAIPAENLPQGLPEMREFLAVYAPGTRVALDGSGQGTAEGIVLRTDDRSVIAKARFEDYDRTLRKLAMQAGEKRSS